MRRKILFVLGSYTYGGTIFSTFNMLSFLKSHYDIYILALSPYGPIKEMYDQYNKLQTSPRLKAYSNSRTGNEDSLWQRILLVCHKIVSHLFLSFGYDISDYIFRMEAKRIAEHYSFDVVASTQEGISTRFVSLYDAPLRVAWFRSE